MPQYVDGFLIAVPKKNLARYKKDAALGRKIWLKHGALDYRECIADDLNAPFGKNFSKLLKLKKDETAVFSWITYKSKAHRDRVNAKVMKDPKMQPPSSPKEMPFKMNRMSYGGFTTLVKK